MLYCASMNLLLSLKGKLILKSTSFLIKLLKKLLIPTFSLAHKFKKPWRPYQLQQLQAKSSRKSVSARKTSQSPSRKHVSIVFWVWDKSRKSVTKNSLNSLSLFRISCLMEVNKFETSPKLDWPCFAKIWEIGIVRWGVKSMPVTLSQSANLWQNHRISQKMLVMKDTIRFGNLRRKECDNWNKILTQSKVKNWSFHRLRSKRKMQNHWRKKS